MRLTQKKMRKLEAAYLTFALSMPPITDPSVTLVRFSHEFALREGMTTDEIAREFILAQGAVMRWLIDKEDQIAGVVMEA